jgi:hypothetical protein
MTERARATRMPAAGEEPEVRSRHNRTRELRPAFGSEAAKDRGEADRVLA